jgi:non-ribosomal peptide synthetase component F
VLNYRYSTKPAEHEGMTNLAGGDRTNYPVGIAIDDLGQAFGLTFKSAFPISPGRLCAMVNRALEQLVEALETHPANPVGQLDILPAAERQKLLVDWNATEAEYPKDVCVHQLFEAQVARDPAATAVVYEDQSLSYGELNLRANRLAHYLRTLGVGPDQPVAICVERSLEMVVGLLAILKAGGAYVPLDPAYPSARLSYMLKDSAPAVVLTHEAAKASLQAAMDQAGSAIKMVDLLSDANDWASQSPVNPDPKNPQPHIQQSRLHHLHLRFYWPTQRCHGRT